MKNVIFRFRAAAWLCAALLVSGCDYGEVGGADTTTTLSGKDMERVLDSFDGVWYSHYAKRKLDGYRIGKWKDLEKRVPPERLHKLFPYFDIKNPTFKEATAFNPTYKDSPPPKPDDYFLCYDDTPFEAAPGDGGGNGWGFGYMGIVRAVNIFNNNPKTGVIIIEYLNGAYPDWSKYNDDPSSPAARSAKAIRNTPLPFFGMYYRVKSDDCIQMANAVKLKELSEGKLYHTETATLKEATDFNDAMSDQELIAWGIVVPQDKEKE